jgi:peptidyl-prolyl cis-trans isomerase SurA
MFQNFFRQPVKQALPYLVASFALLPMIVMAQGGTATQPLDSIVALVDEDVILRSELDLAMEGIVERIRASGDAMPPRDLLEKQVLERLIVRELQVQRALQTGIRVSDADIDQALVGLAQQNGITVQQMRQVIESDGEDFAEFRRNIGEELMTDRLRQRIVGSMPPITDTEVDILLASEDVSGGEYNISHIMLSLPEGATPAQIRVGQQKADEIYQKLQDGLDFASAAISYSDSQEALEGGEVGWRDLTGSLPTPFVTSTRVISLNPSAARGDFTWSRSTTTASNGKWLSRNTRHGTS